MNQEAINIFYKKVSTNLEKNKNEYDKLKKYYEAGGKFNTRGEENLFYEREGNIKLAEEALNNIDAAYASYVIQKLTYYVYYPNYTFENKIRLLSEFTEIDEKDIRNAYSNDCDIFRQNILDLMGIPVKVPTLSESIKTFHDISSSDYLTLDEKMIQQAKMQQFSGFNRSIENYYGKGLPALVAQNPFTVDGLMDYTGVYDLLYENGLEKKNDFNL